MRERGGGWTEGVGGREGGRKRERELENLFVNGCCVGVHDDETENHDDDNDDESDDNNDDK